MSAPAVRDRWLGWQPGDAIIQATDENQLTQLTEAPFSQFRPARP